MCIIHIEPWGQPHMFPIGPNLGAALLTGSCARPTYRSQLKAACPTPHGAVNLADMRRPVWGALLSIFVTLFTQIPTYSIQNWIFILFTFFYKKRTLLSRTIRSIELRKKNQQEDPWLQNLSILKYQRNKSRRWLQGPRITLTILSIKLHVHVYHETKCYWQKN